LTLVHLLPTFGLAAFAPTSSDDVVKRKSAVINPKERFML